jgi:chromosome segregation ATPase
LQWDELLAERDALRERVGWCVVAADLFERLRDDAARRSVRFDDAGQRAECHYALGQVDAFKQCMYELRNRVNMPVKSKIAELETENAALRERVESLEKELDDWRNSVNATSPDYAKEAYHQRLEQIERLMKDWQDASKRAKHAEAERDTFREQLDKLEANNRSYALSAAHAHEREVAANARVAPLNMELIKTQQERDDARTDVRHLFSSLDEAKAEIVRLGQSVWSLETMNAALRERVGKLHDGIIAFSEIFTYGPVTYMRVADGAVELRRLAGCHPDHESSKHRNVGDGEKQIG